MSARQDGSLVYVCTATLREALFVDIAKERMWGVQGTLVLLCLVARLSHMAKEGSSVLEYFHCCDFVLW